MEKKITIEHFLKFKKGDQNLTMVTAYDATFAKLIDQTEVDAVLVGDSLGMVMQGKESTLGVSVDDVVYHTRCVRQGLKRAFLVADMPFMSYQVSSSLAVENAGRLISEGGAQAVKLEGGEEVAEASQKMVHYGIPVMGHLGLTPQSIHQFGGFKVQGRSEEAREKLIYDAKALQEVGCFALVLESIPQDAAKAVTEAVRIPTIGIGAGPYCDGQVLVIYDLLNMDPQFNPKFLKKYANGFSIVKESVGAFVNDVREGKFPTEEHSFH